MRIGYPCINLSLPCRSSRTFRIKHYSSQRLVDTVNENLDCLQQILKFNVDNNILFFRITSDLIPFASHKVCRFRWQDFFCRRLNGIGRYITNNNIRVSMHPSQFVIINSRNRKLVNSSISELYYHAQVMDLMGLDRSCKIQIHIGGIYGEKKKSMGRFIERFSKLDKIIKKRLVIENDERSYSLKDCMEIHSETGLPVVFDTLHHSVNNCGEPLKKALLTAAGTWKAKDGPLMVDYSSQDKSKRSGAHAGSIDRRDFTMFLKETKPLDFDVMLEIKDKDRSALEALKAASGDKRLVCVK